MHRPTACFAAVLVSIFALAAPARAANVLVVSDASTDTNISNVLRGDGHTLTLVTNDFMIGMNPTLRSDLSAYDCVFWSATGPGFGGQHSFAEVFAALSDYVSGGGRVFVTGYNSISYPDPLLIAFLGGTSANGYPGTPGAITAVESSLTVGVVDLRGVTPYAWSSDYDGLLGLAPDTLQIAGSTGGGAGGAQWTLRTLGSGEIAFVSNGDYATSTPASWANASAGPQGAYNAAIRNFAAASEGSASEEGAPTVRFVAPFGATEGAAIDVVIEVSDAEGDATTFSWDLDGDGTYGERAGETTYTVPSGATDGDGTYRISVEATDGTHTTQRTRSVRIANVAPEVVSRPPPNVSVDQNIRYHLQVVDPGGAADPLVFRLVQGPPSSDVTPDGTFRWVPSESDVTSGRPGVQVQIEIDDGDGGITMHEWRMEVSANHAPSALMALYPIGGIALLDTQPRLAVANGTDVDDDALEYFFELDAVETFDSPDLLEAGPIAQTDGYTAWTVEPALRVGLWHWRAWASDGEAETEPVGGSFYVVPDPDDLPDGGPGVDDGGVDGGTAPMPTDGARGCACSAVGGGGSAPWLLIAGVLALLGARRRRS